MEALCCVLKLDILSLLSTGSTQEDRKCPDMIEKLLTSLLSVDQQKQTNRVDKDMF